MDEKFHKIGFTGTHSTGKSTIVEILNNLREFKEYELFTSVSRQLKKNGINLNKESDFLGQISFMGKRASEMINEKFVGDRSIYDVMAYSLASKNITKKEKKILLSIFKEIYKQYDVIFYLPIEFDMDKDGTRPEDEEYRIEIRDIIEELLTKYAPKRLVILEGNVEDRLSQIMKLMR